LHQLSAENERLRQGRRRREDKVKTVASRMELRRVLVPSECIALRVHVNAFIQIACSLSLSLSLVQK